jgi:hypothetical protein
MIQGDLPHVNFEAGSRMKLTARTPGTPCFFFKTVFPGALAGDSL